MAFLPALAAAAAPAAAGTVATTAGAAALAKGAALASSTSLASGIAAGSALGSGAAGLFANAAPALGGLKAGTIIPGLASTTPAVASAAGTAGAFGQAAPGLLQTAGMNPLGGMTSVLPTGTSIPSAGGIQSLATNAPNATNYLMQGPNAATNVSPVQNYLTQMPGESSRVGLKLTSEAPSGAEISRLRLTPEATQTALTPAGSPIQPNAGFLENFGNLVQNPSLRGARDYIEKHPFASMYGASMAAKALSSDYEPPKTSKGMIRPYKFERTPIASGTKPSADGGEQVYLRDTFTALDPYEAPGEEYEKEAASGGLMGLAVGGAVEQMSARNAVGSNTMYPQSQLQTPMYSNPMIQRPIQNNVITHGLDAPVEQYSGDQKFAEGGEAKTEGGYKYSFDPKTQVFTQLSVPKLVPETRQSNYIGGGVGGGSGQQYVRYTGEGVPPGGDYQYISGGMSGPAHYLVPASSQAPKTPMNTGPKTSGGIATPTGGLPPLAPTVPTAPLQPPINVPAYQSPEEQLGLTDFYKMMNQQLAQQGGYAAGGGVYDLGGYSDGGRLLRGPGDGVSDSIPAVIGNRQPARLADGEFVVPARIVSELGNGSTEAGARKLYAMMDRVQKARRKTVGKNKVAKNTKADKFLPA